MPRVASGVDFVQILEGFVDIVLEGLMRRFRKIVATQLWFEGI